MLSASSPAQTQSRPNIPDIAGLNASAIYEQEFQDFLVSTSRSLHILQENLKALENLVQIAQQLANVMHESINPQKRNAPIASILPLEQEKKKW
ncbi:26809_t:CDS:2 [Gigaspora margarita]|uniref:26809_t:CDS:1 n=1 Tax=Gigaspora margarita TaxID=4874 RepID=A0ABN7VJ43_GIGMA|nr:26809_t:CDS:2 [Gigaspora margarita]